MKQYFIASFCRQGILGGGILADSESVTYKTGKLTVPAAYRNLQMNYRDIRRVSEGRLLGLPTVTLGMADGEEYKFVIFARKKFLALLRRMGVQTENP